MVEAPDSQRLDKWLCYARFAKTRTVAQALVEGGKVRLNRETIKSSSRMIRADDVLTIRLSRDVMVVRVIGFAQRRVSPPETAYLYEVVTG
ncbi:RNA-binding S4 domain-containing protein [Acuticoccus sp. I52.16.1]|uniref:RNA-binding S4 domain-containing protein n=1 Tax=Acuticoccus sp. I52.16.1 TaxID=2928472 RepID=UPI00211351FF|nr:RNA-binding S4 domain-containing protein [Acuticoccus sp. I52.16.1]